MNLGAMALFTVAHLSPCLITTAFTVLGNIS